MKKSNNNKNIGINGKAKIRITRDDGSELVSPQRKKLQDFLADNSASYTPISDIKSTNPVFTEGKSMSGKKYSRRLSINSQMIGPLSLWFEDDPSPAKRLKIDEEIALASEVNETKIETFGFDVSRNNLRRSPRIISQNQVKKGRAKDHLKSQGIEVEQTNVKFHWAHRQACMFGGKQLSNNMDATTATSNYETLYCVEKPIQNLVFKHKVPSIDVEGKIYFLPSKTQVPNKIEYFFKNPQAQARVVIDPLGCKSSTSSERRAMNALINSTFK